MHLIFGFWLLFMGVGQHNKINLHWITIRKIYIQNGSEVAIVHLHFLPFAFSFSRIWDLHEFKENVSDCFPYCMHIWIQYHTFLRIWLDPINLSLSRDCGSPAVVPQPTSDNSAGAQVHHCRSTNRPCSQRLQGIQTVALDYSSLICFGQDSYSTERVGLV